jgi:hypothetical protein
MASLVDLIAPVIELHRWRGHSPGVGVCATSCSCRQFFLARDPAKSPEELAAAADRLWSTHVATECVEVARTIGRALGVDVDRR